MKKFDQYFFFMAILALLMLGGFSLIILAVALDWMGLSEPGFSRNQASLAIAGASAIILSVSLYFIRGRILERLNWDVISAKKHDIFVAFALFCLGVVVGTVYFSVIKSTGGGLFYTPTKIVPMLIIDWLKPLYPYGIFLGIVSSLAYGIFRLGMGRLISSICALMLTVSSFQLYFLIPSIGRDYIKEPFIFAVVLIIGLMVITPLKRAQFQLALSTFAGIVIGTGLWFRLDLIVFIIPFIVVVVFFFPGHLLSNIKIKITSLVFFTVAMLLMLLFQSHVPGGGSGAFAAVGGLMSPLDGRLEVTGAAYDWGYVFLDQYIHAVSHAMNVVTLDYDCNEIRNFRNEADYLWTIVTHFPADMLTRTYASVLKILEIPFTYLEPPVGIDNEQIVSIYNWRAELLGLFAGAGFYFTIVALIMISMHSLRLAFFCLFFIVFLAGYPVLQFQGRHYFHLEFIGWWSFGFVIQQGILFVYNLRTSVGSPVSVEFAYSNPRNWWTPSTRSTLIFIFISAVILLIPFLALRKYQISQVADLFHEYTHAEVEPLLLVQNPINNDTVLISSPDQFKVVPEECTMGVAADFLVAEFNHNKCDSSVIWPILRYEYDQHYLDFSRMLSITNSSNSETTKLFFPALAYKYDNESTYFKGIEMPLEQASCLQGLYKVKSPNRFPIMTTALLPSSEALYQKLSKWEGSELHTFPIDLPISTAKDIFTESYIPLEADEINFQDEIAHFESGHWIVSGHTSPQYDACLSLTLNRANSNLARASLLRGEVCKVDTDLLISKRVELTKGNYFVAQGELFSGGVTFSIIIDNHTVGFVDVTSIGSFSVVIEVPEDGFYTIGVANNLDMYTSLENRLVVTKIGWATLGN